MRYTAKAPVAPADAPASGQRHLETLLALTGSPALALGSVDDIAKEISARSLAAFQLEAAQVWRQAGGWQCLTDARRSKTDTAVYPEPGEILSPDLAARTADCPVIGADETPIVILRLIKPVDGQWSKEEIGIADGYTNVLTNAVGMALLRGKIENLVNAKISAEEANRSKTEFMANMSHELRTPLNAIIGFSEILAQEYFGVHRDPRYKDYAQDILHSGQHLLSLINDILDLSRIESGKQHLQEEAVNLDELLQSAMRLVRGRANDRAQRVHIKGDSGITLFADTRAIKQIVVNLLSNAIKYSSDNENIEILVTLGSNLSVTVRDTGRGITAHRLAELFQPFNRGQEDAAQTTEGAGLGLVIARKLARLHGGDLILQSEVGVGTAAILTLPHERLIGDALGILPWDIRA